MLKQPRLRLGTARGAVVFGRYSGDIILAGLKPTVISHLFRKWICFLITDSVCQAHPAYFRIFILSVRHGVVRYALPRVTRRRCD